MAAILGVRCWSDSFAYVVLGGSQHAPRVLAATYVPLPVSDLRPAQLASFRKDIHDILSAHGVTQAYFRKTEGNSKTKDQGRAELEGVLQEACFSHTPSVSVDGRLKAQLKKALQYSGRAADVFQLFNQPVFVKARLAKTHFDEAAVTALSGL